MNGFWQTERELISESPSRPIGRLVFVVMIRKSEKESKDVGVQTSVKMELLQAYVRIELHETRG